MMESFAKKYILEQKKSEVLYEKLRELSELDYLTNLLNRRTFENYFNNWRSTKTYLSVASVDLDFFKKINDQWGHSYGDEVLKTVAEQLTIISNQANALAFRVGGEEFLLLIPYKLDEAGKYLIKLRELFVHVDFSHGPVTFSSGLAQVKKDESKDELLRRVDKLLYMAKDQGRNCIVNELQMEAFQNKGMLDASKAS